MNELIEKLKKNEKPFVDLSEEEKECLRKVGLKNCDVISRWGWSQFYSDEIFRIKPDYQPDPEYADYEIETHGKDGLLHIHYLGRKVIALHEIPSMPNFRGLFAGQKDNPCLRLRPDEVAQHMAGKPFARLVKD